MIERSVACAAKTFTSWAQDMGMCAPATAISKVATPGISQAGTACAGSCLPLSSRVATTKLNNTVLAAPSAQTVCASDSPYGAMTDDNKSNAIVNVPKKLPVIG